MAWLVYLCADRVTCMGLGAPWVRVDGRVGLLAAVETTMRLVLHAIEPHARGLPFRLSGLRRRAPHLQFSRRPSAIAARDWCTTRNYSQRSRASEREIGVPLETTASGREHPHLQRDVVNTHARQPRNGGRDGRPSEASPH